MAVHDKRRRTALAHAAMKCTPLSPAAAAGAPAHAPAQRAARGGPALPRGGLRCRGERFEPSDAAHAGGAGVRARARVVWRRRPPDPRARRGHLAAVEVLIVHGADVNCRSKTGSTPLWEAAASGYLAVVQALLKAAEKTQTAQRV